jgi:hypothetical protein
MNAESRYASASGIYRRAHFAAAPLIEEIIMGELSRDRVDRSTGTPKPKSTTSASKPGAKPAAERGVDEQGNPHALVLTARATAGRLIIAHRQT